MNVKRGHSLKGIDKFKVFLKKNKGKKKEKTHN